MSHRGTRRDGASRAAQPREKSFLVYSSCFGESFSASFAHEDRLRLQKKKKPVNIPALKIVRMQWITHQEMPDFSMTFQSSLSLRIYKRESSSGYFGNDAVRTCIQSSAERPFTPLIGFNHIKKKKNVIRSLIVCRPFPMRSVQFCVCTERKQLIPRSQFPSRYFR